MVSALLAAEIDKLAAELGGLARREVPIGPLTTYRVGGAARLFCELSTDDDIAHLSAALVDSPVPLLVIGKGSNLLVADRGWDGLCVHLGDAFTTITVDELDVVAGGATPYPVLARRSGAAGLTGMEWAVGIPDRSGAP